VSHTTPLLGRHCDCEAYNGQINTNVNHTRLLLLQPPFLLAEEKHHHPLFWSGTKKKGHKERQPATADFLDCCTERKAGTKPIESKHTKTHTEVVHYLPLLKQIL